MQDLHLVLGFLVVALIIILVVKSRKGRAASPPSGPPAPLRDLAKPSLAEKPAPRRDPMTRPVDDPGQPE